MIRVLFGMISVTSFGIDAVVMFGTQRIRFPDKSEMGE